MKLLISISRQLTSLPTRITISSKRTSLTGVLFRTMVTSRCINRFPRDPNTLSNYDKWRTQHTVADLFIDFDNQKLDGTVTLQLESQTEKESKEIVLDTSYLDVISITANGELKDNSKWSLAERMEPYGSALTIQLEEGVSKGTNIELAIEVSTTKKCTALQWLTPAQTKGEHPYMFSQCQSIHARSLFPCQDTPDSKSTYDFRIHSSLPVIASGVPVPGQQGVDFKSKTGAKLYQFKQAMPMASYLFALASGEIANAEIGPRSCVACGPKELAGAKWELEKDTENFIKVAEKLIFPYAWGQYNVLVLPPSFPYGGMENPVFTFATPTIISGDRQNIDVIAHELAHSWSGNLVSNASWEHFWLNEGWTVYLERRIQAAVHGEPERDFSAIIGWKALEDSVALHGKDHEYTKLIVDLEGKDPDDMYSSVPYEKGFHFLYYIEKLVSKSKFDKFIPHYFTKFAKKSLDSYQFKETLLDFFKDDAEAAKKLEEIDWDTWYYAPGMPPKPDFDTSLVEKCLALAETWKTDASYKPSSSDIESFNANQIVVFIESLLSSFDAHPLTAAQTSLLGKTYNLYDTQNVELNSRFFQLGLLAKDKSVYAPTSELLSRVGRMKFVRPLYRRLTSASRELALKTFEENKGFYHPICRVMIEKDLGVKA